MKRLRQLLRVICGVIVLLAVFCAILIIVPAYITGAYRWEYSSWQIKNVPPTWDLFDSPFIALILYFVLMPFDGLLLFFLSIGGIITVLWQHKLFLRREMYFWLIALSCSAIFTYSTRSITSMFVDWLID